MLRHLSLLLIAATAVGCGRNGSTEPEASICEKAITEAAWENPIPASLTYYRGVSITASIDECPKDYFSVLFQKRDDDLRFLELLRERQEVPIVLAVRFRVVGFDFGKRTLVIDRLELLDR